MDGLTEFELVVAAVALAGAGISARRKQRLVAASFASLALLTAYAVSVILVVLMVGLLGVSGWARWNHSAAKTQRWARRLERKGGVASNFDVLRFTSFIAMRRRAAVLLPTVALSTSVWQRLWRLRARDLAMRMVRAGWFWSWSSRENVVLAFGGPRTGKTGWLGGEIIDAPGGCLVTSSRTDLYDKTSGLRAKVGPVYVFNAAGLADIPSTITFDPLTGCSDPVTAAHRANDLLGGAIDESSDRGHWEGNARRVLAALLHAAALGNRSMRDVLTWVSDPTLGRRDVITFLRRSTQPAYLTAAEQFLKMDEDNKKTSTSITTSIMKALQWLTSPAAAAAGSNTCPVSVSSIIESRGTVYLLGAEEGHTAPLVAALTGHIARECRRLASLSPDGRLDPPFSLFLDEAAIICPVPLDNWTADMGGRNITIVAAFQSFADVRSRWGNNGADRILNNSAAVIAYGGTKTPADLQNWEMLVGRRARITDGQYRGDEPVISAAQFSSLPFGNAVVLQRGIPPLVGRTRMYWKRADWKAQRNLERRERRLDARAVSALAGDLAGVGVDPWVTRAMVWAGELGGRAWARVGDGSRWVFAQWAARTSRPGAEVAIPAQEAGGPFVVDQTGTVERVSDR